MISRQKPDFSAAGPALCRLWQRLSPLPGGAWLFGRIIGWVNPYTGSVQPRFRELGPGRATVQLREARPVRNHVGSVHAIALMNLGEMTTGLALMAGLPPAARAIPVKLCIEYYKKARGTLTARCRCNPPQSSDRQEVELVAQITDEAGQDVARATAHWLVGPRRG